MNSDRDDERLPARVSSHGPPAEEAAGAGDRRADERMALSLPAACVQSTFRTVVHLLDVSESGACVRVANGLCPSPGQFVGLELLDGSRLEAEVRWVRGNLCGLLFATRVSVSDIAYVEHLGSSLYSLIVQSQRDAKT